MEQAQLNLDYTKIVSPLDGIAGQQEAQIGDLVGTGANSVLTTVSQINPIWFYLPISEQSLLGVCRSFKRDDGGAGGQTQGERRTHPA